MAESAAAPAARSPRKELETSSARAERLRRERDAKIQAEREELERHLASVDERLKKQRMAVQAQEVKRQTRVFLEAQREPPRRKMYDDKELAQKALIPGPGTYTPRLMREAAGKTFGAAKYDPAVKYDKNQGSFDSFKEKMAYSQPSPASYSPRNEFSGLGQGRTSHHAGSTFGLPPRLMETYPHAEVPSAHDMERMVSHLREIPGPGSHTPREPQPRNLAFRMATPSGARGALNGGTPGPGSYESPIGVASTQATGRSPTLSGPVAAMSQLEMAMVLSKTVPGPGRYESPTTMRSKGAPRFSPGKEIDFIQSVMNDAKTKPGPGAHGFTPTFAEELEYTRGMRAAADEQLAQGRA